MKRIHGMSKSRLYRIWTSMKTRCYNEHDTNYQHYGARGIGMCEEWRSDFVSFYDWAMDTGYDESAPRGQYTIERIDNDGPYSPENCRWATIKEQENNKSNNIHVVVDGEIKTLKQWCDETGRNYANEKKAHQRRRKGIRAMDEYNKEREIETKKKCAILESLIKENPSMTNAMLASKMGYSSRYIQRLKKRLSIG